MKEWIWTQRCASGETRDVKLTDAERRAVEAQPGFPGWEDGELVAVPPARTGPTLHEALAARGYTTGPAAGLYRKIVLRAGEPVFTGTASDVWAWLGVAP